MAISTTTQRWLPMYVFLILTNSGAMAFGNIECSLLQIEKLEQLELKLRDIEKVAIIDYEGTDPRSMKSASHVGAALPSRKVAVHARFFGMKRGMNHAVSVWIRRLFLLQGNVEYLNNVHFINRGVEFSGMQYGAPHGKVENRELNDVEAASGTALEFWSPGSPERSFMQRVIRSDDMEPLNRVDHPDWRISRLATSISREAQVRRENSLGNEPLAAQIVGFEDFSLSVENYRRIPDLALRRGTPSRVVNIAVIRDFRSIIASRLRFADGMENSRHMEVGEQAVDAMLNIAHLGLSRAVAAGRMSEVEFNQVFPEGKHPLADEILVVNATRWANEERYRVELAVELGFTAEAALKTSTRERSQYGVGRGASSSSFGPSGENKQAASERERYENDPRLLEIYRRFPRLSAVERWLDRV